MRKILIVNADDFGITRGATDAIIACHLAGSVTSTTLMSTQPAAEYAVGQARLHEQLGVGLHFNLTHGRGSSAGSASSITRGDGSFLDRRQLVLRAVAGRVSVLDLSRELEAQYDAMRDLGLTPTHLDSHQHVHVIGPIFRVVTDFALRHGLPLRLPWRWRGAARGKPPVRRMKEAVMAFGLRRCVAAMPPQTLVNDGFCSVFDLGLSAGEIDIHAYQRLLAPYSEGAVELMVHPAEVDTELMEKTAITGVSAAEDRLLRNADFAVSMRGMGFQLDNYSRLQRD